MGKNLGKNIGPLGENIGTPGRIYIPAKNSFLGVGRGISSNLLQVRGLGYNRTFRVTKGGPLEIVAAESPLSVSDLQNSVLFREFFRKSNGGTLGKSKILKKSPELSPEFGMAVGDSVLQNIPGKIFVL